LTPAQSKNFNVLLMPMAVVCKFSSQLAFAPTISRARYHRFFSFGVHGYHGDGVGRSQHACALRIGRPLAGLIRAQARSHDGGVPGFCRRRPLAADRAQARPYG